MRWEKRSSNFLGRTREGWKADEMGCGFEVWTLLAFQWTVIPNLVSLDRKFRF